MAERVGISVLMPVLDEARGLQEVLEAMCAQRFDGRVEFLVIDGGSQDGTPDIVQRAARSDERIKLLHNPARRTPQALNLGLQAARGEYVARMDAHTLYPLTYLADGVERLRRGDVVHVSGPQLPYGTRPGSRRTALALRSRLGVGGASFRLEAEAETEVDTGFAGVWRRDTLERIGGWSEGWPVNQDGELAARLRRSGGRLVCLPSMAARYVPRDSLRALGRQYWRYGRYKSKTCRRYPEAMRRSHALPPALVMVMGAALLPRPRRVRRLGRLGALGYGIGLAGEAVRMRRTGGGWWALPAVWATMHVAWGAGFLTDACRCGPPWRALAQVAPRRRARA